MIAAIRENGKIHIGYSYRSSDGVFYEDYLLRENVPCIVDGDLIVFFALSCASSNYLLANEEIFTGEITVDTIRKNILPEIKRAAAKYCCMSGDDWMNSMVICKNDRLFVISADFYVREETDYVCIGYSSGFAKSVFDTERELPPKERIKRAFEFYERATGEGSSPVVYLNTEEKNLKVLNGGDGNERDVIL